MWVWVLWHFRLHRFLLWGFLKQFCCGQMMLSQDKNLLFHFDNTCWSAAFLHQWNFQLSRANNECVILLARIFSQWCQHSLHCQLSCPSMQTHNWLQGWACIRFISNCINCSSNRVDYLFGLLFRTLPFCSKKIFNNKGIVSEIMFLRLWFEVAVILAMDCKQVVSWWWHFCVQLVSVFHVT